ncbi:MAG: anthranilate synthase component I family protein [Clostridiales bacterium]|nr:anthranilate synthase component I family protein [Clostridiales bacterium]
MQIVRKVSKQCYLLESAKASGERGRFSFLGYDPTLELTCGDGILKIRKRENGNEVIITEEVVHPKEKIMELLEEYKSPKILGLPPFTGGFVGYISYEYFKYAEPSLQKKKEATEETMEDTDLMLLNQVIVFDHFRQKIILITGVSLKGESKQLEVEYEKAKEELERMEQLLKSEEKAFFAPLELKEPLKLKFSKEQFEQMVKKVKEWIREGNISQVVLSNPMKAKAKGSLFDSYCTLKALNPSPYMFYFSNDCVEIAGASPETLVKLEDNTLMTFPLAGTRKRGETKEEDERLERELLADEKERAEHNMLVDLGKNDLEKISESGTVLLERYMEVVKYSHVMHISSKISGKLKKEKQVLDIVDAVLPAGTLSGTPKRKACEIIEQLEGEKRGIYGGAIGYFDFAGNADLCIAIRLIYKKDGIVCVQSGAGIVEDSIPENEFWECKNKAQAMIKAIELAREESD